MKLNRSQLFAAFAVFWIGLGWLGLMLTLIGAFYKVFLGAYFFLGLVALIFLFIFNWEEVKKVNRHFFYVLPSSILIIIIFLIFSTPTIFSGRDEGSLSGAAISLAENHQLKFSFPAEKEFFQIYGAGQALNFPGFNYTTDGQLITQFPLGYIAWLAIFYSVFGLAGLTLANGVLLFLFALAFYFLARIYLRTSSAYFGLLLILTSFPIFWFSKFTLSENMALALVWLGVLFFVQFFREEKKFYLFSSVITMGFLAFARIEALAFLVMMVIFLFFRARWVGVNLRTLVSRKILWILATMAGVYAVFIAVDSQFFIALIKGFIKPFSGYANAAEIGNSLWNSAFYIGKVFFAYYLLHFLFFGFIGFIYILKKNKAAAIPFLIILPSFIYLIFPNISADHPWMLRRFAFSIIPAGVFYTIMLLDGIFKKRAFFYAFSSIMLAFNLFLMVRFLPIIPHQKLMSGVSQMLPNFSNSDLILVDQQASGDGWSMITGPLNFVYGKQAVYFLNPADLDKLNIHNYPEVYFIVPDSRLDFYAQSGLLERMAPVKNYTLENNFLRSDIFGKNAAQASPVILPTEQKITVSGKLYLLKK
ncbi:MAG: hypothetical protein WC608_01185 [Parcubacteria group bacterium]